MNDILIYGAGGFGREIACMLDSINEIQPQWNLLGFLDDGINEGTTNRYGKVLGNIDVLNKWPHKVAVAMAIASPKILKNLTEKIQNDKVWFPNLMAPNVRVFDPNAFQMGKGNLIFFGCRLSCDVSIGNFNIFNGAVSLGHDVILGSHNVLGPSVRISGDCRVGDENFFGVNAVVLQGQKVGNNTRIGGGSVVIKNTKDGFLYMGNPAKRIIQ